MAEIGTATIKITPVIDEDALAALDTVVAEAVAEALRRVADSLVAPSQAAAEEADLPRYYLTEINGLWGIRDREHSEEWAGFGSDTYDKAVAEEATTALNEGDPRDDWSWTSPGTV